MRIPTRGTGILAVMPSFLSSAAQSALSLWPKFDLKRSNLKECCSPAETADRIPVGGSIDIRGAGSRIEIPVYPDGILTEICVH
jgi:hypothetical protein